MWSSFSSILESLLSTRTNASLLSHRSSIASQVNLRLKALINKMILMMRVVNTWQHTAHSSPDKNSPRTEHRPLSALSAAVIEQPEEMRLLLQRRVAASGGSAGQIVLCAPLSVMLSTHTSLCACFCTFGVCVLGFLHFGVFV